MFTGSEVILIFRSISEGINLVEYHNHRLHCVSAYICQSLIHHINLILKLWMTDIYHMHQHVSLPYLIER